MERYLAYVEFYEIFLLLAFGLALWTREWKRNTLPCFFWLLVFHLISELVVSYWLAVQYGSNLRYMFFYACAAGYYYFYVFLTANLQIKNRKYFWLLLYAHAVFLIWIELNYDPPDMLYTYLYLCMVILVQMLIFYYFYSLLMSEEYRDLSAIPQFWLGIGLTLFFTTSFTSLFFFQYKATPHLSFNWFSQTLLQLGNIFIFGSYIAVLLCQRKSATT